MNYKIQKHKRHHLVYTTSTRLLPGALYSLHKSSPPPYSNYVIYIILCWNCSVVLSNDWISNGVEGGGGRISWGPFIHIENDGQRLNVSIYIYTAHTFYFYRERYSKNQPLHKRHQQQQQFQKGGSDRARDGGRERYLSRRTYNIIRRPCLYWGARERIVAVLYIHSGGGGGVLFSNRSKLLEIQRGDRGRVQGAYNINADSYLSDGHYSRVLFQFREPVLHAEQLHAGAAARCFNSV